jgi:hypothetical protein
MSKQTAVIWFNQQLIERQNGNGDRRSWSEILRDALQIERQQIVEAHIYGHNAPSSTIKQYDAQQYFNETYGGQNDN